MKRFQFFIFCLPRSRSAWIANLLTWGPSLCYHELIPECPDFSDFAKAFDRPGITGNADSTNVLFCDYIFSAFPEARYVWIDRNPDDIDESVKNIGTEMMLPEEMKRLASAVRLDIAKRGHLLLDFDNWSPESTRKLWEWCLPGIEFPVLRNDQLEHMNVQITRDWWNQYERKPDNIALQKMRDLLVT